MLKMATTSSNTKEIQALSGQWNVQIARGKVTTKCLWNACKALSIGLLLMSVGAAMAVVGYYADQLSIENEIRGNFTIRIKNESRGFHLNNLSYAGPIIMGIGGFIVVAACVMTFEARDSAAKVVPARFRTSTNCSEHVSSSKSTPRTFSGPRRAEDRVSAICSAGLSRESYKMSNFSSGDRSPINDPLARKLFTSAFVQVSRGLARDSSKMGRHHRNRGNVSEGNLNRSPSAPNLLSPAGKVAASLGHRLNNDRGVQKPTDGRPSKAGQQVRTLDYLTLLSPRLLQRQALSMDNPFYKSDECFTPTTSGLCSRCSGGKSDGSRDSLHMELGASAGAGGSQVSMALDLHDCQVTLAVKDESQNRRSDTSRRHQLLRQRPVEDEKEAFVCLRSPQVSPVPQHFCKRSDDSLAKRSDPNRLMFQSAKPNQISAFPPGFYDRSFSRSRSSADEKQEIETEQKIHPRERAKRSEKLRRQRCTSEHAWSPEPSPPAAGTPPHVRSKNEGTASAAPRDAPPNQETRPKNDGATEEAPAQHPGGNASGDEPEERALRGPGAAGSPPPTSGTEKHTTTDDAGGSAEKRENAKTWESTAPS